MKRPVIKNNQRSITPRETAAFVTYLSEIKKIPVLTPDHEFRLFCEMKAGSTSAREKLIKHNLKFVISVAKKHYSYRGTEDLYEFSDLVQCGNHGLVRAVDRFDASTGFKFISYAVFHIQAKIMDFIVSSGFVKVPAPIMREIKRIEKAIEAEECDHNLQLQVDDVICKMGYVTKKLKTVYNAYRSGQKKNWVRMHDELPDTLSFYDRDHKVDLQEKTGNRIIDKIADPCPTKMPDYKLTEVESMEINAGRVLHTLTSREAEIICLSFGVGGCDTMTLVEMADKYDLSKDRVRAIREKALRRLRHPSRANILLGRGPKEYLNFRQFKKEFGSYLDQLADRSLLFRRETKTKDAWL